MVEYLTTRRTKSRGSGKNLGEVAAKREAKSGTYKYAVRTHGRAGTIIDNDLETLYETYNRKSESDRLKKATM